MGAITIEPHASLFVHLSSNFSRSRLAALEKINTALRGTKTSSSNQAVLSMGALSLFQRRSN